jgi:hypothetical protein
VTSKFDDVARRTREERMESIERLVKEWGQINRHVFQRWQEATKSEFAPTVERIYGASLDLAESATKTGIEMVGVWGRASAEGLRAIGGMVPVGTYADQSLALTERWVEASTKAVGLHFTFYRELRPAIVADITTNVVQAVIHATPKQDEVEKAIHRVFELQGALGSLVPSRSSRGNSEGSPSVPQERPLRKALASTSADSDASA